MPRHRILVAEGDAITAKHIQRCLETLGYDCAAWAATPQQALAAANETRPDLVLVDTGLQEAVDGIRAAEQIRAVLDVPIVYLTSFSGEDTLQSAKISEPYGYLLKPFSERELHSTVEMALQAHQFKRQLRASEARYRALFEQNRDAILLADAETGEILDCNQATEALFGWVRQELIGQPQRILHPPYQLAQKRLTETFLLHQAEAQGQALETQIVTKTGQVKEVSIQANLLEVEGQRLLQGVFRDISEQKRNEQELRFHSQILEHIQDAITVTDLEGRIQYANRASVEPLGLTRQQVLGQSTTIFASLPEQAAMQEEILRKTLADGTWQGEVVNQAADGSQRILDCRTWLMRDSTGQPKSLIGVSTDITEKKQMITALHESESRLRLLLEALPDSVYVLDGDWRHVLVNAAAERFTRLPREALLSQRLTDLFPGIEATSFFQAFQRVMETLQPETVVSEYLFPDGRTGWYEVRVHPIPGGILCVSTDITERQRAGEVLARRANQLTILSQIASDIAALTPLEQALARAVQLMHDRFGYHHVSIFMLDSGRKELVMKTKAGDFSFPAGHRLALGQGMVGWVAQSGQRLLSNDVSLEPRYVNLYPGTVPTQSELAKPILVGDQVAGVLDIQSPELNAFDEIDVITVRVLADQIAVAIENARLYEAIGYELAERQKSEAKYRTLIESLQEGVWAIDQDAQTTFVNPRMAEMLGYTVEEMLGKHLFDFMDAAGVENCLSYLERREQGIQEQHDFTFLRKDGSQVYTLIETAPLLGENGQYIGAIAGVTDITERRNMEAQLRKALGEKETLLKEIYHRVKNNLQVVSSLLSLPSAQIQDPSALEIFKESQNRIKSMAFIHEKLYRSKDLQHIDFAEYLHSLAASLRQSYRASHIQIIVQAQDVFLDIDQAVPCGLIVNELVSNALKHAFPGEQPGKIHIEMQPHKSGYILDICDNGIGLPEGVEIWNKGSLGLQIVTALSRQLNGSIESFPPNIQGTGFRLKFARPGDDR
ncbi:MAG: PAS domain S-box protein [Chloroflexota bacterium]